MKTFDTKVTQGSKTLHNKITIVEGSQYLTVTVSDLFQPGTDIQVVKNGSNLTIVASPSIIQRTPQPNDKIVYNPAFVAGK